MKRVVALLLLLAAGCKSHTVIHRHETAPVATRTAALTADAAVVLLGRPAGAGGQTDHDFVACVGDHLAAAPATPRVIAETEFVDALYPWFETATAPTSVEMLEPLFRVTAVRDRIEAMNVRYLVWIEGRTETVDSRGGVTCAAGPGGAGCFGLKSWDDEAAYEARLWSVDERESGGRISTRTTGTSYVPAVIVPLPLLARVKSAACDSMADQLQSFLSPPR